MHLLTAARALLHQSIRSQFTPTSVRLAEPLLVGTYLSILTIALARMAALRMYWFDELFTLHLARSPSRLWANLAAGADNNPPLSYLITALSVSVFGEVEWAMRLPAIGGAVVASLCLYLFVRRRRGPAEAILAAAAIGPTAPIWIYFIEARPYGPMIGFAALALLAWQRATEVATRRGIWLITFTAAVVGGLATHYYFVVPLAALAVAEAVRTICRRKLDRPLLAGFAAAALTLAALYPLWGFGPQSYAPGFWSKVRFTRAAIEDAFWGMAAKELVLPGAIALTVGVLAGAIRSRVSNAKPAGEESEQGYPLWEVVALVALAISPVLGVWLGAKLVGAYYYRYTLPAAIGLAGLMAFVIGRVSGSTRWGCLLAAIGFAITGAAGQWKDGPNHFRAEVREIQSTADFLATHAAGGLVVVESPFEFARLWHYGPQQPFSPAFLADPEQAIAHTRSDTTDRGLQALNRVTPVPVVGFGDIERRLTAGIPTYYFGPRIGCPGGEIDAPIDARGVRARWLPWELAARGVQFEPVATRGNTTLYRLQR